jgi:hypothetical protein
VLTDQEVLTMNPRSLDELPDVLTIPETAAFLRVSEGVAYDMARQYRRTNGRLGLPVFMAGRRMMRVAKLDLVRYINGETGRDAGTSD